MESLMKTLSLTIGVSEPALRLLISTLLGYPLALAYRTFMLQKNETIKNIFISATGISLCYFNYGYDLRHSLAAVLFTYLNIKFLYGSVHSVVLQFIVLMGHLLLGYYYTASDTYDIKWTMPHCVLVLRLIGLVTDIYDGQIDPAKLSARYKQSALKTPPSLLEILGYTYFPSSFLVGPQFPIVRYKKFISGVYDKENGLYSYGIKRFSMGCLYLLFNQIGTAWLSDEYLLSDDYANQHIIKRIIFMGLWGKFTLYKYISIWLLTEGACISFGLTYNETKKDWSGCQNINPYLFENAQCFGDYIESFNENTNSWVANYVFTRLRFLGNKYLSQVGSLLFLAIWHGFHSGYYMCFFMEFAIMFFEKEFLSMVTRSQPAMNIFDSTFMIPLKFVFLKFYTVVNMGYCMIPFVFLSYTKWWQLYSIVQFYGFIIFLPWVFLYKPILHVALKTLNSIYSPVKND